MLSHVDEMIRTIVAKTVLGLFFCIFWTRSVVECSRADLGTYLNIKELPGPEEKVALDSFIYASINYTFKTPDMQEFHYNEEKARYGEGRILNVHGILVHVADFRDPADHTGCSPHFLHPNRFSDHGSWIALIQRGGCTFEEKIKNAHWNKAVGVIVYNEETSVNLEKMKIIDKDRNITAVFTHKWIGEELATIVDSGTRVWVSITEGQRVLKPMANINKTSVLFVSISFIVLMIISLVWLIFYYVQRFRYLQSKDQHSRQLCTVAKRIIGKIPTKSGKNEDKDSENDCCAICIEPYKATDCIRVLPCRHEFHKNCIDPWLLEHRTCPMCKLDVLKHYGFVFFGSQESIIQLDLDIEVGDRNLHQPDSDEDPRNMDHPIRITISPPANDMQTYEGGSHQVIRRSSLDTMTITRRTSIPERSHSSMSHCSNDEPISNRLFFFQTSVTKAAKNVAKTVDSNLLNPSCSRRDKESISLPGTLKKHKSTATSHGSNNCYVMAAAADLKHLATRLEKGNPAIGTCLLRKDNDNELLLSNDKTELDLEPQLLAPPAAFSELGEHSKDV